VIVYNSVLSYFKENRFVILYNMSVCFVHSVKSGNSKESIKEIAPQ